MAQTFVKSPPKSDSEYSSERDAIYVYVRDNNGKWLCAIDNCYGIDHLTKPVKRVRQNRASADDNK